MVLVSHYSAIGDTISCDAPYSAMGFRGKLFLRYPPFLACLLTAIGHLQGRSIGGRGISVGSLRIWCPFEFSWVLESLHVGLESLDCGNVGLTSDLNSRDLCSVQPQILRKLHLAEKIV